MVFFRCKIFIMFFLIFPKNIDRWYTSEPPTFGGSNEYPQSMFKSIKKKPEDQWSCKRSSDCWPGIITTDDFLKFTLFVKFSDLDKNHMKLSHQDNMSVLFIPPYTPLLYSKTGVYRGVHFSYFCSKT